MDMTQWAVQVLVPIVIAMLGSTWFGNFMNNLRMGNVTNKDVMAAINDIKAKVELNAKIYEEDKAEQWRMMILRFDDELRQDLGHSLEYFDNILHIISEYEKYCIDHPGYKNRKAIAAIEHIVEAYDECHAKNSFI